MKEDDYWGDKVIKKVKKESRDCQIIKMIKKIKINFEILF